MASTASPLRAQEEEALAAEQETIDSPYRWIERGLRLGLTGGYYLANRGNLDFGPGSTPIIGAQFRARVSSPLTLEINVTYGPSDRWVIDPRLEDGPAPVDTVGADWLLAQAGAQIGLSGARTWHGIHPFLRLGGGFMFGVNNEKSTVLEGNLPPVEGTPNVDEIEHLRYSIGGSPNIYFGGGAEVFPSERIGISLEFRDIILRLKSPSGWFAPDILFGIAESGAEAPKESQWVHSLEMALTLFYYF